jgi:hypothetical protein
MNYIEVIKECYSYSDFCKELDVSINGREIKKVKKIIEDNNLDISHFNKGYSKRVIKYDRVIKACPVCENEFIALKGHKKEKTTCSHSCSNTFYRSGKDNPNWKEESNQYRLKCFLYHEKKCVVCSENKIVDVHHLDENRDNNDIFNLIPLCPTHHRYWHSIHKKEIENTVSNYIEDFKKSFIK